MFKNLDDIGDFEVTCKKCGSTDIWVFYSEEFYDPGYSVETTLSLSCRLCKNRIRLELGDIQAAA